MEASFPNWAAFRASVANWKTFPTVFRQHNADLVSLSEAERSTSFTLKCPLEQQRGGGDGNEREERQIDHVAANGRQAGVLQD